MTIPTDPAGDLCATRDRIVSAVLYRVFVERAYSGRTTANESADLDHAFDREDEAFADYATALRRATPVPDVVPAPVLRPCLNPVGWEAYPPDGDPVHVRVVCPSPVEALDDYRRLYPLARRLRECRLSASAASSCRPLRTGPCPGPDDADDYGPWDDDEAPF